MAEQEKLIVYTFVLGLFLGAAGTAGLMTKAWRAELIRRGHAEYNQQTGVWQMKEQQQ